MSLATIQDAWDDFEKAVKRVESSDWRGPLIALTAPASLDEPGLALRRVGDLLRESIDYCARDGWYGKLTINGEPTNSVTAVLMENGRVIGVRRIATDEKGNRLFSRTHMIHEDVYGDVGGSLQQKTGRRVTFTNGLVTANPA